MDEFLPFSYLNDQVLQWNIRGLQANREELDMLLSLFHPSVICLQETFLRESKNITFKGFSSYQKPAQEINGVLHGGSAILVNSSIPHRQRSANMSASYRYSHILSKKL